MNQPSIGIVGVGLLGSALAEQFLHHGWKVTGYDADASRCEHLVKIGGTALESSPGVAESCDRILLSLPDSDVVEAVVDEMEPELAGKMLIDTTTGDPRRTAALAARLAGLGVRYLDAAVGGSSQQAREGDVIVMAGGAVEHFAESEGVFRCFARRWFHVGPCGSGARMKLVLNLVLGLNRAVLAEGFCFARACGIEPAAALEVLREGPTYSRVMDTKGRKMLDEDFSPQARLSQHLKDVRMILDAGTENGAALPFSSLHRVLLEDLAARGFGDADNSAILKAFE